MDDRTCSVEGCIRSVRTRGWCNAHYQRWLKHGDPHTVKHIVFIKAVRSTEDTAAYYRKNVDCSDPDGCWPWIGPFDDKPGHGYGRIWDGIRTVPAHRWGYLYLVGPIPDETPYVLHTCDNRLCNRPDHWFLGTHADNMADKIAKGRQSHARCPGETNGQAKLTAAQVQEIRSLYAAGGISQRELGAQFGIVQTHVSDLIRGERWGHLIVAESNA